MKKVMGFALFCMALGMFIMMLLSESCMGRDHTGVAASDRIPAVLLLAGTAVSVQTCSSISLRFISLTGVRPIEKKIKSRFQVNLNRLFIFSLHV